MKAKDLDPKLLWVRSLPLSSSWLVVVEWPNLLFPGGVIQGTVRYIVLDLAIFCHFWLLYCLTRIWIYHSIKYDRDSLVYLICGHGYLSAPLLPLRGSCQILMFIPFSTSSFYRNSVIWLMVGTLLVKQTGPDVHFLSFFKVEFYVMWLMTMKYCCLQRLCFLSNSG